MTWRRSKMAAACCFSETMGVPMSDSTLTTVLRRMGRGDRTARGLRSTFRDWAADTTGYPNHVVEQAGPRPCRPVCACCRAAVEADHRRGDLYATRKALVNDWAAYLAEPPANVGSDGGRCSMG